MLFTFLQHTHMTVTDNDAWWSRYPSTFLMTAALKAITFQTVNIRVCQELQRVHHYSYKISRLQLPILLLHRHSNLSQIASSIKPFCQNIDSQIKRKILDSVYPDRKLNSCFLKYHINGACAKHTKQFTKNNIHVWVRSYNLNLSSFLDEYISK